MKIKVIGAVVILPVILLAIWAFPLRTSGASRTACNLPTSAPTPAGQASASIPAPMSTTPPLAQPLTANQALERIMFLDQSVSRWDHPWSRMTLITEPGRIAVDWYRSMDDYRAQSGDCSSMGAEIEADIGSVWQITIRGRRLSLLACGLCGNQPLYCDRVSYLISQRTAALVATREC